jgi:hypothetical protein
MDGFGSRADSHESGHERASAAITSTASRGRVSFNSPRHGKARGRIRIRLPSSLLKMILILCTITILSGKVNVVEGFTLSVKVVLHVNGGSGLCNVGGSSSRREEVAELTEVHVQTGRRRTMTSLMAKMEPNDNTLDNDKDDDDDWDMMDVGDASGVVLDDLTWRVEKLRLEEQNKRRFLKSGARFLPYAECRKWVQAWGKSYWQTREDWYNWIAMGEKRNAYIPSRPDEYYTKSGDWISWEHFLITPPESSTAAAAATACNTTDTEYDDQDVQQRQKPK